jgi:hypothetical protein
MKKVLMALCAAVSLEAAEHALYTHSLEAVGGFALNSSDSKLDDNWNMGFRYNYNRDTYSNWDIGALQFSFDYSGSTDYVNGYGETSVYRFGSNLLWYADNESDITPYALIGVGAQFFDNESGGEEDGVFGTFGGGIEYQMRGDFSLMAEGKWLYAGDSGDYILGNFGVKYSFGN